MGVLIWEGEQKLMLMQLANRPIAILGSHEGGELILTHHRKYGEEHCDFFFVVLE